MEIVSRVEVDGWVGLMVLEFGDVRFRPVEREDLKLLHGWENDFDVIMFSRGRPLDFVNVDQLERMYEEWVKDEKHLHCIVELISSGEAVGTAPFAFSVLGGGG